MTAGLKTTDPMQRWSALSSLAGRLKRPAAPHRSAIEALIPPPPLRLGDLRVAFNGTEVVRGVDLTVEAGQTVGVVGESGSGKSVTFLAAMGLLGREAAVSGTIRFAGQNPAGLSARARARMRGRDVALIPQDPGAALNPIARIGTQLGEVLRIHQGLTGQAARAEALRLLDLVGIPAAARRLDDYAFSFSGGQKQRLVIALALAGRPRLLIADEPTTALDVTIQAQILDLLRGVQREFGMAMVLISHDLGVILGNCSEVAVFYAGRIVERGPSAAVFAAPHHPYTRGLIRSMPDLDTEVDRLDVIPGRVPDMRRLPPGCAFYPRCDRARPDCLTTDPALQPSGKGRLLACPPALRDALPGAGACARPDPATARPDSQRVPA